MTQPRSREGSPFEWVQRASIRCTRSRRFEPQNFYVMHETTKEVMGTDRGSRLTIWKLLWIVLWTGVVQYAFVLLLR